MHNYTVAEAISFTEKRSIGPTLTMKEFILAYSEMFFPSVSHSFIDLFIKLITRSNAHRFIVGQSMLLDYGLIKPSSTYESIRIKFAKLKLVENVDWTSIKMESKDQTIYVVPQVFFKLIRGSKPKNVHVVRRVFQLRCLKRGFVHFLQYESLRQRACNLKKDQEIHTLRVQIALLERENRSLRMREHARELEFLDSFANYDFEL